MAGFNAEVKKRITQLKTGIHLVVIQDATLVKGDDGKPKLTSKGEVGITIKFADGKNNIFEHVYYTNGDREYFFKKMCTAAQINLETVKKTGKFKAEAKGKRLWIYIKEVYDIDGEELVINDITGQPEINYYIFNTSVCINPDNRPGVKGDPAKNDGKASDDFIEYRQVSYSTNKQIGADNDDFDDISFETKPKVEVKGNKAFVETYERISKTMVPNNNFTEQKEPQAKPFMEDEIDFDDF